MRNWSEQPFSVGEKPGRLHWLDIARGVALVAMAIYHLGWDLEFFGYLTAGTTGNGAWRIFARAIASSFLFLAGFSLVLGHYPTIRWRAFLRRLATIVAAALAITMATWFATPSHFIFFGILHAIAVASLLGLFFLRFPPLFTALIGLAFIVLPQVFSATVFDRPWLWWVGLATIKPVSNDYVPVFPWFGPALLGIAVARMTLEKGWLFRLRGPDRLSGTKWLLAFAGRHSLAVYLLHQPLLIAAVYLASLVLPPAEVDPRNAYLDSCVRSCSATQSQGFCQRFCACTLEELDQRELFGALMEGRLDPADDPRSTGIADQCAAQILERNGNAE